jgi:signal transduction histidine kinase
MQKLSSLPVIVKILLLGIVYWLFCWIGTLTFYRDYGLAIYWPATGIAILGVYVLGRNASSAIFIVAVIMNYFIYSKGYQNTTSLVLSILAIATANTVGAILGSQCLKMRVLKAGRSFFRLDSIVAFLLFVALIPSLITSLTGGTVVYFSGVTPDFFYKAHSWLLADLIGVLVMVPIAIAWMESPKIKINKNKIIEFVTIIVLMIISGYLIFTDFFGNYIYNFLIAYFTTPLYMWLALRYDSKAVTSIQVLSLVCISYLAIYSGKDYLGTFVEKPYILLQGFSILISVLILIVHSIFSERSLYIASLQKSEEKYRSLFENMPVSLWEDDFSEVKQYIDSWPQKFKADIIGTLKNNSEIRHEATSKIKIVNLNKNSLDLYGESSKRKLIQNVSEVVASNDSDALFSILAAFYSGKSILEERLIEVKIKKNKRFLSVRCFVMPGYEKSLSRILITIMDITDLKKAEKEIRLLNHNLEKKVTKRTEDLNRANLELEAFAYSVSHDLKAPLRAVRGFSGLLLDEYGKLLPEDAVQYIKNVQKNTDKMTLLITDLLQFSKLGRKSITYTEVDTFKLAKTIWEDMFSLQKPEKITFTVNPLPIVKADEAMLTQVFVNLFSNAVKFSKPGSQSRIEVSCKTGSGFHEFCIRDEGIGFDQKFADKIFKVFQRLHTEEEYEGSGVGLALAQRIIYRHGGNIWAVGEPGQGTSIFFSLPVEIDSE